MASSQLSPAATRDLASGGTEETEHRPDLLRRRRLLLFPLALLCLIALCASMLVGSRAIPPADEIGRAHV